MIPIAPGIEDTSDIRKKYYDIVLDRLSKYCQIDLKQIIEYERSYCINDFIQDYNSYKGNAYGLANTLSQTANVKPKIVNKHIDNLFYAGQLTVPGFRLAVHQSAWLIVTKDNCACCANATVSTIPASIA